MNKPAVNIFWFRRDLRFEDNAGLFHALQAGLPVQPVFIFDTEILDQLEDKADRRVEFIHAALEGLQDRLIPLGATLEVHHGKPSDVFAKLAGRYQISAVFTNRDYEPYARKRDQAVADLLGKSGIAFTSFKDHVIFEEAEVMKDDGRPYTVFTPYSRKWRSVKGTGHLPCFDTAPFLGHFFRQEPLLIPTLEAIGFAATGLAFPPASVSDELIRAYGEKRNFPAIRGTSRLGVHLRFGTLSIRQLANRAMALHESFLNELIWRDFYHMILFHFPQVGEGRAFKPAYERIPWRNDEAEFDAWCKGMTGYPIVDAGMRELNATGFMHNRVRMITASFLTKHLLIDWRWGEAYFARKLLDFDLAANNGGWQWAAGSGCDAAPYFRVFNPALQTEKFDKKGLYIRQWVPEFDTLTYPAPMVAHELARKRCLDVYARALKNDT